MCTIDESADTNFHWSLEIYDPGSSAKRMLIGWGAGTAHVQGLVTITKGGEEIGLYEFSARPKMARGAKDLALLPKKILDGGENEELHEYEKATKAAEEEAKNAGK